MPIFSKSDSKERMSSAAAGRAAQTSKRKNSGADGAIMQGKFPDREPLGQSTSSGIPESVQTKMEGALNTDLSGVKVHANSSKAADVGASAYTQGADIHIAPGHYSPGTSAGKQLLGHELTHVAQQMAGRVQPTGEVGGLPLNDSPSLEKEADSLGAKAI